MTVDLEGNVVRRGLPDQRPKVRQESIGGTGQVAHDTSTQLDKSWGADPAPFLTLNMVRDQIALVSALGYRKAAPPSFPFAGTERKPAYTAADLDAEFAKLNPPRLCSPCFTWPS